MVGHRKGHAASLPPPGGVMLERLVMLGALTLIAFGIFTAFL
jgi:hypothetical protein